MHRPRRIGALFLLLPVLAGCVTGERPYFEDDTPADTAATGDAAIDAVLQRLESVDAATFTAHLDVLTRFGSITTPVVIAQSGTERVSVTIGHIRYLHDGDAARTCDMTTGDCVEGFNEAMVSDLQLTHEFYSAGATARLRQDARVMVGPSTGSQQQVGDQAATCVSVPVDGGSKTYCALDNGVLTSMDTADLLVTLTSYSTAAEEPLFSPT